MTALRAHNLRRRLAVMVVAALVGVGAGAAFAQTTTGVPNALQGFSQNRDKPVQIDAATLEVRDKDKTATFSGNVRAVQGDTTLRSNTLLVFYDQGGEGTKVSQAGSKQQIRRLEAKGNVVVTQKEQTATGETAIYDLPSNTVTLQGNVVLTQCANVMRGDRLIVNLGTGVSRVETKGSAGVRALIQPGGGGPGSGAGCDGQKPAPARDPGFGLGIGRPGQAN